jgi:hypothetical protein
MNPRHMGPDYRATELDRNPWLENVFYPVAIGGMVGCVAWSLAKLVDAYVFIWNPVFLTACCVLVAWEAVYSYRLFHTRLILRLNVWRFRGAELLAIFILIRIGSYLGDSWSEVLADVRSWPQDPAAIIGIRTILAFPLALFFWSAATQTMHDLDRLGERPVPGRWYVPPTESLFGRFFWGGAVLLITAGLTRVAISEFVKLDRPAVPGLVLNALLYFLLGLVTLGQIHLARLRKRWQTEEIQVASGLARRWTRYSLAFIGLAVILAFLLPTGYTVGLLDAVRFAIGVLVQVFLVLYTVITFPFQLLLWLLSMLLGEPQPAPEFERPQFEPPPQAPAANGSGPDWIALVRTLLFWAFILGGMFYVIRSYLRDRPGLQRALAGFRPIRTLRQAAAALWRWLRVRLGRLRQTISEHLPRRWPGELSRGAASAARRLSVFRLGALSPRERVLYYYLSILRRADKLGFSRRRDQTPYEYDAMMEPHLTEAQQEMRSLTGAFVEARYSRHEFDPDQDRQVRARWKRVRAALQSLKRRRDDA